MKQSRARQNLSDRADERKKADKRAAKAFAKQKTAVLDAFESGLRYNEITAITGWSTPRIGQVLREEREKRYG